MVTYPCAKINLGLNIVSKRPDGYHNLETVFYPIDIHDKLEIEEKPEDGIELLVGGLQVECEPSKNLVVKAYNLISQDITLPGVRVKLSKHIPMQAGMGGGSSDGAYMIRLLNDFLHLGLGKEQMVRYASQLGADCAFFVESRPAYATGIGDKLTPCAVSELNGRYIALVKPDVAVSTKEAYAGIKPCQPQCNCLDIVQKPIETWREWLKNDFEDSIFKKLPVLSDIKQGMYDDGAIYAAMSGSGSTIFGIFDEKPSDTELKYSDYYVEIIKL